MRGHVAYPRSLSYEPNVSAASTARLVATHYTMVDDLAYNFISVLWIQSSTGEAKRPFLFLYAKPSHAVVSKVALLCLYARPFGRVAFAAKNSDSLGVPEQGKGRHPP